MPEAQRNALTSLTYTFTSFLTVCVHTILYHRDIYPRESFLTTRAYNFPVAQSRHPKVCQWITDAVAAVEAQMLRGNDNMGEAGGWVEKVVLVIFSEQSEVMERYVFDVHKFPRVPVREIDTDFVREKAPLATSSITAQRKSNFVPPAQVEIDLAEQFRAVLLQISNLGTKLSALPENCTYSLAIELSDPADPPIGHPQPWIPVEPRLQRRVGEKSTFSGGTETTAVRKVDAGEMIFEMWIEEGKAKSDSTDNNIQSSSSSGLYS